jgi:N-acyl-D-aspartate/D-glutamate deacylase
MSRYDLKITGGLIVDGTGRPSYEGDVAITGGQVVAMGTVDGPAREVIDAERQVVSPGFVDIHTHYDAQVLWDRRVTISPWHGVTTVVIGNCGFGIAPTRPAHRELIMQTLQKVEGMSIDALREGLGPAWPFTTFPEYLDVLERGGLGVNVAAYVGHTPLRLFVMGDEAAQRPASPREIEQMCAILREAIAAGALGFGTSRADTHIGFGGLPVPSRLASDDELRAFARVIGECGEGVMQVTIDRRDYLAWMADLATLSGRPITWAALLAGYGGPGSQRPILERTAALQRNGLEIVPQISCRPVIFDYDFTEPFALEPIACMARLAAGSREERLAAYRDPTFRRLLAEGISQRRPRFWEQSRFAHVPGAADLTDRVVSAVAAERNQEPVDLVLDMALATDLELRIATALTNVDEEEIAELLLSPHVVLALSDAGAHASQICDSCYTTYLLAHWVRDKRILTLEEGIRHLTSRPAEVVGIKDRGVLAAGRPADIVIFDADTVAAGPAQRVDDLPAGATRLVAPALGIHAVIVNGTVIREDGEDAIGPGRVLPGRLLRHGEACTDATSVPGA